MASDCPCRLRYRIPYHLLSRYLLSPRACRLSRLTSDPRYACRLYANTQQPNVSSLDLVRSFGHLPRAFATRLPPARSHLTDCMPFSSTTALRPHTLSTSPGSANTTRLHRAPITALPFRHLVRYT